jgi:hypothetical protein
MKKILVGLAVLVVVGQLVRYATYSNAPDPATSDFAEKSERSNRLFKECFTDKIKASCDELDRLYPDK